MFSFPSNIFAYKEFNDMHLLAYYVDGTLDSDPSLSIYNKMTNRTDQLFIPYKINYLHFLEEKNGLVYLLGTGDNHAHIYSYDKTATNEVEVVEQKEAFTIDNLFSEKNEIDQSSSAICEINKIEGDFSGPSEIIEMAGTRILLTGGRKFNMRVIGDSYEGTVFLKEGQQDGIADGQSISTHDGNVIIAASNGIQCINLKRRHFGFIKQLSELAIFNERIICAQWTEDGKEFYLQTDRSLYLYNINNFDQKFIAECSFGFHMTPTHIFSFAKKNILKIDRNTGEQIEFMNPAEGIRSMSIIDHLLFLTVKNETVLLLLSSILRENKNLVFSRNNIFYMRQINFENIKLKNFDILDHLQSELQTISYETINIDNPLLQYCLFDRTSTRDEDLTIPSKIFLNLLRNEPVDYTGKNKYLQIYFAMKDEKYEPLFSFEENEMAIVYFILLKKGREDLIKNISLPPAIEKYSKMEFQEIELKDYPVAIHMKKNEDTEFLENIFNGKIQPPVEKEVIKKEEKKNAMSIDSLSQQLLNLNRSSSTVSPPLKNVDHAKIKSSQPEISHKNNANNIKEIREKYFSIVEDRGIGSLLYDMKRKQAIEIGKKTFDQLEQNIPSHEFNELFNALFFIIKDFQDLARSTDMSRLSEFNTLLSGSATEQARLIDERFNVKLGDNLIALLLLGMRFKLKNFK